MRTWIALALLAVSWLLGLHYDQPADWPGWTAAVVVGVMLLAQRPRRLPARSDLGLAALAMLPAVWYLPWPYRAAPLLVSVGTALLWIGIPRRWAESLWWGTIKAGLVLLAQSLTMEAYAIGTARCHDLPWPLPSWVGWVASLAGFDAAVDGKSVVLHSISRVHHLTASWDLLVDPATLLFFVGALVLLGLSAFDRRDTPGGLRSMGTLVLLMAAWLPVRVGLLMAIMMDRGLRADPNLPSLLMNQFFDARVDLLFLIGPVLLAWRFVPLAGGPGGEQGARHHEVTLRPSPRNLSPRYLGGLAMIGIAVATAGFLFHWDPIGHAKGGRVTVVERHSDWEPTTRPYDTQSYGEDPSYSYSGIYNYCKQFYRMSQLLQTDAIDDASLANCDVLVIKTPTARYSQDEVAAVQRFVEAGGGLLLVGEHNLMNISTYLNDLARPFGFKFRDDLLFCIGSPYVQWVVPAPVPHPAVQYVPPMHYAVSCSIDPGRSLGRAAVRSAGLWSLPADYNSENFFPQAEYRTDMRFGAFIQLWTTRHGNGRVAAFTDSTVFSNFSTFEPGKPDLMLGMLQWLNHRSIWDNGRLRLALVVLLAAAAIGLVFVGLKRIGLQRQAWLVLVAAGTSGWTLGAVAVLELQQWGMPRLEAQPPILETPSPMLEAPSPMKHVVLDRTVSNVPLSRGGFTEEDGLGYGLLEQWIPRLGYYTSRETGQATFSGDLLVVIAPTRSVTRQYRESLQRYVAQGGKLLVFDSPDVEGTTSGAVLWPFGMEIDHRGAAEGKLRLAEGWPAIELGSACRVRGGQPLMWVGETPVAARTDFGKGSVMAIGFGSLMNDANMGYHWMAEPSESQRTVFDLLFMLVRSAVEDEPERPPR